MELGEYLHIEETVHSQNLFLYRMSVVVNFQFVQLDYWVTRVQNKCNFDYINLTFLVLDLGCEVSICTVGLLPSPEHVQLWLPPVSNGKAIQLSPCIIKNWAILLKIPFKQPCFVPTNSCLSTTGIGQKFDADRWSGREGMSRKKRTIIAKNLPNSNNV